MALAGAFAVALGLIEVIKALVKRAQNNGRKDPLLVLLESQMETLTRVVAILERGDKTLDRLEASAHDLHAWHFERLDETGRPLAFFPWDRLATEFEKVRAQMTRIEKNVIVLTDSRG